MEVGTVTSIAIGEMSPNKIKENEEGVPPTSFPLSVVKHHVVPDRDYSGNQNQTGSFQPQ